MRVCDYFASLVVLYYSIQLNLLKVWKSLLQLRLPSFVYTSEFTLSSLARTSTIALQRFNEVKS